MRFVIILTALSLVSQTKIVSPNEASEDAELKATVLPSWKPWTVPREYVIRDSSSMKKFTVWSWQPFLCTSDARELTKDFSSTQLTSVKPRFANGYV